ncbi:MAG TPA: T9SS type A sorting domain-containing protein [Cytophagaceae bacterium]|jgi:hypothetical protein
MKKITTSFFLLCYSALIALGQNADVAPLKVGNLYQIIVNGVVMEIDPAVGARITSFKIGNNDTQKKKANTSDNDFGSSLQPAPQSLWNWPPPPNIDNKPYAASISNNQVVCIGTADDALKLSVDKKFSGFKSDTSIVIEYIVNNKGTTTRSVSPWEVTKINSGGLIFYPKGTGAGTDLATWTTTTNSIVWYDHDSTLVSSKSGGSFRSDGAEGWYANVQNSGLVFIKKFTDTPAAQQAPGENEIKVFIQGSNGYLSYELQGPYVSIPANNSVSWKVKWYLRQLPASIKPTKGSTQLVDFVRNTIAAKVTSLEEPNGLSGMEASIFPQPAFKEFVIKFNQKDFSAIDLSIVNMQGVEVKKVLNIKDGQAIQTANLMKGVYTYQLRNELNILKTGKLVIE